MPRRIVLPLFFLLLGCATAGPAGDGETPSADRSEPILRLGIVGDQTLAEDLDAAYAVLARGVEELGKYHREVAPLDAVVHVGDLVESGESPDSVQRRFSAAAGVLEVDAGGDTRVALLPLDGEPLTLPGRRDMERAQALEVMLGGALWDLSRRTPLSSAADGSLVADCTTKEPARLALERLGNPIDREVTVAVELAPPAVAIDGDFAPGFCGEPSEQTSERRAAGGGAAEAPADPPLHLHRTVTLPLSPCP